MSLEDLIAKERRAHPASPDAKARVWSRLESSLGAGPGGGGGGAPASAAPGPRPTAPPISRMFVRLSLAACIVGASIALYTVATRLPNSDAPVRPRIASSVESLPRTITLAAGTTKAIDAVEPPAAASHLESAPVGPAATTTTTEVACAICDEQRILEPGRRGLREKHYDEALAAIREHESHFPNGQLAEERESLRVHVLVAMGRAADAERAKADFRREFPASPLLDSVDHAGAAQ